jgi:lysophospholipase L1-like esterase
MTEQKLLATTRRTRGGWLVNLLVISVSIAIALILAETGTRLFIYFFKPNVMTLDDELGWTHRPNVCRTYYIEDHDALVETNALGLRGTLYTGTSHHTRVLILGDSFTDGLEVSNSELFSVILDQARPDLEIVNAGVGGYGTVQELLALERLEPIIRPDLVILMVYVNDLTDNVMPFYGGYGPRPYVDHEGSIRPIVWDSFDPLLLPFPGRRWLHEHSLLAYLVRNRLWLPFRQAELSSYIDGWRTARPEDTKWKLLQGLVSKASNGRNLLVVALPTRDDVQSNDRQFALRIKELAAHADATFLDLQPVLRPEHFFVNDIHWNPFGHRVVASHLNKVLK